MKVKDMNADVIAAWAAGLFNAAAATLKAVGLKAVFGIVGAALLFLAAPPERPDGTFSRHEFVIRLSVAGVFSVVFGDWFVDVVNSTWPSLLAAKHPGPFWLACGAPGWWITRWAALWLYARKDKDAAQVLDDIRKEVHP